MEKNIKELIKIIFAKLYFPPVLKSNPEEKTISLDLINQSWIN